MARWQRGEAEIEALITAGDLQKLTGDAANGERLVARAAVTSETARPRGPRSNAIPTPRSSSPTTPPGRR